MLLMSCEVVVGSVGNAPKLAPAKGEQVLQVRGCLAVEAQLLRRVIPGPQLIILDA